jgi:hypothetical protein
MSWPEHFLFSKWRRRVKPKRKKGGERSKEHIRGRKIRGKKIKGNRGCE